MNEQEKQYIRDFFKGVGIDGTSDVEIQFNDMYNDVLLVYYNKECVTCLHFPKDWHIPTIPDKPRCAKCERAIDLFPMGTLFLCGDCLNKLDDRYTPKECYKCGTSEHIERISERTYLCHDCYHELERQGTLENYHIPD